MNKYIVILVASVLVSAPAHATTYSAQSIRAQVVDANTNQPLEGVIVVAHWQWERKYASPIGVVGNDPRGPLQLKILETVTDQQGRFYIPAWSSSLPSQTDTYLLGIDPRIVMQKPQPKDFDSRIILFKPGYAYNRANPAPGALITTARSPLSQVNDRTIKLKKFEGNLQAYASDLLALGVDLYFATAYQNCDWKQIPKMLAATQKQRQLFNSNNVSNSNLPTIYDLPNPDECGFTADSLKEFLK